MHAMSNVRNAHLIHLHSLHWSLLEESTESTMVPDDYKRSSTSCRQLLTKHSSRASRVASLAARPLPLLSTPRIGVLIGSRQGRRLASARASPAALARSLQGCAVLAHSPCEITAAATHRYARGSSQPPRTPPAKASRSPRTFSQGTPAVAALRQAYARLAAGRIRSSEHSSCSAARVPHGTGQPGNTQPDQLSPGYHHIPNRYQHQA